MPFRSEKQRRYMHQRHPEIAERWERDYGKLSEAGGISSAGHGGALLGKFSGKLCAKCKGILSTYIGSNAGEAHPHYSYDEGPFAGQRFPKKLPAGLAAKMCGKCAKLLAVDDKELARSFVITPTRDHPLIYKGAISNVRALAQRDQDRVGEDIADKLGLGVGHDDLMDFYGKAHDGASPQWNAQPIPDMQDIYFIPRDPKEAKRQKEAREQRNRSTARRNQGRFGFHGEAPEPTLRYESDDRVAPQIPRLMKPTKRARDVKARLFATRTPQTKAKRRPAPRER